ncbi:PLP-dependent aminotransferase family protein [Agrococcus sp. ARC_14]|uniref:MocR-like transcription factor YczR n=1 Tax=Agrococcus sp. ARC_14 TaxID=2919927 RepID=UPI001F05438A|nr:PLP-dependent aminotransferase family protein [Agrococcus sp. ARC_14]MCH1881534.1 PLP-dependent aminotransferase family protein [Agrococcus sp. ARC_14]
MASRLGTQLGEWQATSGVAQSLADRIRMLLLDGRITVGERLPSERALAAELDRSRATIARAYELLETRGYVTRTHGSGTRAALPTQRIHRPAPAGEGVIDFTMASVGSAPGMYAATVRALDRVAGLLGTPGYSLDGLPELRERIAARFAARGLPTDPDQIVVTSGAMHALTLVLAAFGERGRPALVEQPSFPHALEALRRTGHRLVPTPVSPEDEDSTGWDAAHLIETLRSQRPALAYLIADFHNPTGATMPELERARLAAVARSTGTLLVVDETCAELDIDRGWTPRPFAAHGPAILIGSMSKIAWGGMRIGWIRATSAEQTARLLATRPSIDLGTPLLEQCIAIELLDDMDALLERARERLSAGRAAVAAGLAAHLPGVAMPRVPGGLAAWIDLGGPWSTSLSLGARDRGLLLPPGPRFSPSGVLDRYARIPITWEPEVTNAALERLGSAWRALHAGELPDSTRLAASAVV